MNVYSLSLNSCLDQIFHPPKAVFKSGRCSDHYHSSLNKIMTVSLAILAIGSLLGTVYLWRSRRAVIKNGPSHIIQPGSAQPFVLKPISLEDNQQMQSLILHILEEFKCNRAGFAAQDLSLKNMCEAYQKPRYAYYV